MNVESDNSINSTPYSMLYSVSSMIFVCGVSMINYHLNIYQKIKLIL